MALNPPSRLSTQLFAYLFLAKNTAASAISEDFPKRFRGMEFRAADRASGVMATPTCTLEPCKFWASKQVGWAGEGRQGRPGRGISRHEMQ